MLEKVLALKEKFINASTDAEKEQVDREMQELMNQDPDAWALAMVESAKQTAQRAEETAERLRIREQLEDVLAILPLSYIAEHYFKKSRQWLYQKINGNIVNGKPAQFTQEEIKILNTAFQDLSKKIGSISVA